MCAKFDDTSLVVDNVDYGSINECLCHSDVSEFVATDATIVQEISSGADEHAVTNAINNLISAKGKQCTYPDHSVPSCTADDPCGFVCEGSAQYCHGVCTTGECYPPAYENTIRKNAWCPAGTTACGAYERRGSNSSPFECIHTDTDLESCGGCTTPLDSLSPTGVDCSQLPGVVDVKCKAGACVVNRCSPGYMRAADNSTCVSTQLLQQS
ncbi:hypothetical protein L226DRAFT_576659 [Lentinus tigrinus ALCF2SS1-7]|uniref:Protein CPL1-like domain-containing protein n=1 Tax=Lentinus tigrinus ALCF2SS1-6 TaxID=1328759 RepID=A0A5C2RPR5_9APHY|nr:hypothetical protein L227DRAFT_568298 [Lentinus tigrinus ALCF2SS1-6]RPD68138.1 hypothetical protein L226DRAFT_576659 [Lentinus tigrinus ALCF2SS1-7]